MNLHFHLLSQSNDSIHPTDTKWSLPLAVYPEASALPVKGTKPMAKFEERCFCKAICIHPSRPSKTV